MIKKVISTTLKRAYSYQYSRFHFCQQNQFTKNTQDLNQQINTLKKQLAMKQKDLNAQVNTIQEIIKLKRQLYGQNDAPEDLILLGILYNESQRNEEAKQIVKQLESINYIEYFKDNQIERDLYISQFESLKCLTNSNNLLQNQNILQQYVTKHENFVNSYCPVYKEFISKQPISLKLMKFDYEYTFLINYQTLIGLLAENLKEQGKYNSALQTFSKQYSVLDGFIQLMLKVGEKIFKVETLYEPKVLVDKYQKLLIDRIIISNKICELLAEQQLYPQALRVAKESMKQLTSLFDKKMIEKSNSIYIHTILMQLTILILGNLEPDAQEALKKELENLFQEMPINGQNAELIVTYEMFRISVLEQNPEQLLKVIEKAELHSELLLASYMIIAKYYQKHQQIELTLTYYCKIIFNNSLALANPKQYSFAVEYAIDLAIRLSQFELARKIILNLRTLENYPIQEIDSYILIQETKIKFVELLFQKNNTQAIQKLIYELEMLKTNSEILTFDKELLIGEMYKNIGNTTKAFEYFNKSVEYLKKDPNRQDLLAKLQSELEQMK